MIAPLLLSLFLGRYQAVAECPPAAAFATALRARGATTSTSAIEVSFVVEPDRAIGTLRLQSGATRVVEGARCAEVVEALALVVALLEEPAAEPDPGPALAPAFAAVEARTSSLVPADRGAPGWAVGVFGGAGLGAVPGGAPLLRPFLELALASGPSLRGGFAWSARSGGFDSGATRFSLYAGWIEACPGLALGGGLVLSGCLEVEAGGLVAASSGLEGPGPGPQPWLALGGAGRLAYLGWDPVFLEVELAVLAPLTRPRFLIDPAEVVHEVGWLSPRAGLGAGLRFW